MKTIRIFSLVLTFTSMVHAAPSVKNYSFKYVAAKSNTFTITRTAASKDEAYKLAAKDCFKKLTGNKYPGEEKGLEIIDICANPKI
jgi:hypothetical protein